MGKSKTTSKTTSFAQNKSTFSRNLCFELICNQANMVSSSCIKCVKIKIRAVKKNYFAINI